MTAPPETNTPVTSRRGLRFLAVCGSSLFPGLGHLLVGHWRRAGVWFVISMVGGLVGAIFICSPTLAPMLFLLLPALLMITLAMLVDAFRTARSGPGTAVRHPFMRYLLGVIFLGLVFWGAAERLINFAFGDKLRSYVEAVILPSPPEQDIAHIPSTIARGGAMAPNLVWGDRFLIHKRVEPKRWDIIVFYSPDFPEQRYVMRLVGQPGETIEIVNGKLTVNGQPVQAPANVGPYAGLGPRPPRPRAGQPTGTQGDPITLAADEYFVLGDNSEIAFDSRHWRQTLPDCQRGTLPRSEIIGVASLTYWPLTHWRKLRP